MFRTLSLLLLLVCAGPALAQPKLIAIANFALSVSAGTSFGSTAKAASTSLAASANFCSANSVFAR